MEVRDLIFSSTNIAVTKFSSGSPIPTNRSDTDNMTESSLDLQYAMGLTYPQKVTLLQVGDLIQR